MKQTGWESPVTSNPAAAGGRERERLEVGDQVGEFLGRQAGLEALGHRRLVALGLLLDVRLPHVMLRPLAVDQDQPLVPVRDDEAREDLAVGERERGGAETVGDLLRGEEDRFDQLRPAVIGGDPGQVGAAFAPGAVDPMTLDAAHAPGVVEQSPAAPRVAPVGEGKGGVIVRLQSSTDGREQRGELTVTCVDGPEFEDDRDGQGARSQACPGPAAAPPRGSPPGPCGTRPARRGSSPPGPR